MCSEARKKQARIVIGGGRDDIRRYLIFMCAAKQASKQKGLCEEEGNVDNIPRFFLFMCVAQQSAIKQTTRKDCMRALPTLLDIYFQVCSEAGKQTLKDCARGRAIETTVLDISFRMCSKVILARQANKK